MNEYDNATQVLNSGAKQIFTAATLYDACENAELQGVLNLDELHCDFNFSIAEGEDRLDFHIDGEYSFVLYPDDFSEVHLKKYFSDETEKIFGFNISEEDLVFDSANNRLFLHMQLRLCDPLSSLEKDPRYSENVPRLLSNFLKTHDVFVIFSTEFDPDEETDEFHLKLMQFDHVFTRQKVRELHHQLKAAEEMKDLISDLGKIETMCSLAGNYSAHKGLLPE